METGVFEQGEPIEYSFKSHHSGMETRICCSWRAALETLNRTIVGWKQGMGLLPVMRAGALNRTIVGWKLFVPD